MSAACNDLLCPCVEHSDARTVPEHPKTDICERVARYFLSDGYEAPPVEAVQWMAGRIWKGIEDDLYDLVESGHIKKGKVPF